MADIMPESLSVVSPSSSSSSTLGRVSWTSFSNSSPVRLSWLPLCPFVVVRCVRPCYGLLPFIAYLAHTGIELGSPPS